MIKKAVWIYVTILIVASIGVFFVLKWRENKPIIHHFTSSNIWKAFVLNSIASALIIFIAMVTKKRFDTIHITDDDKEVDDKEVVNKESTNAISVILTLSTTFITSMVSFTILYVLFGFGGGMLIRTPQKL